MPGVEVVSGNGDVVREFPGDVGILPTPPGDPGLPPVEPGPGDVGEVGLCCVKAVNDNATAVLAMHRIRLIMAVPLLDTL